MKIYRFLLDNILFFITAFLLVFIPLFPKLPILDVKNTWVYVRAEDFVVVFVLLVWVMLILFKKITLKTPLTMPIIIFWITAGIATIHAMILVLPDLANVFPNVAFLSFLRRVEYISLFFIGFVSMRDKRFLPYIVLVLSVTLTLVAFYGIGQKYFGFPAYLTMNEEFAKGIPIRLSALSRVPSTFAGHYDLAAYLVLVIPILTSMIFGFRKWIVKILLVTTISLGFILLFMTVSRVSFFVLFISLLVVLFFQKKRLILVSLPILAIIALISLSFAPSLLNRFGNTIKQVDVLIDAKTGSAIGHVREVESKTFENKPILKKYVRNKDELAATLTEGNDLKSVSPSAILSFTVLAPKVVVLTSPDVPTGENLPQGTGYINLSLSPVVKRPGEIFYEKTTPKDASESAEVLMIHGDFLVKRASAYDLSFTTRFQGEWPRAVRAFKRNIFLGSGFSSVSLAVDNNYLRILGEIGLLGFSSFFAIFLVTGIYIKKVLPEVNSPIVKSFTLGFVAGMVGLSLNAVLIDVFEASKIAFLLWLLTGITLGVLSLYQAKNIDLLKSFKEVLTSSFAVIVYLFIASITVFYPMISNFFVGDDFTWFRWVEGCNIFSSNCSVIGTFFRYFVDADGFFYRPGTKIYFTIMYSIFWFNQTIFHTVSLLLHFIVASLVFLIAKKILQDFKLAVLASFLFLILSGYSEAVFWVSSTGFLFNAVFALLSLFFFILWEDRKKNIYLLCSVISIIMGLLFHELGVITPLIIVMYKFTINKTFPISQIFKKIQYLFLLSPLIFYLGIRFIAQSHWFSGDYSYNILKLPFNASGNAIGYVLISLFGSISSTLYQGLRNFSKEHLLFSMAFFLIALTVLVLGYRFLKNSLNTEDKKIVVFGLFFFFISLLPFLGLGNITSRYSYLASIGFVFLFVFLIKKVYMFLQSQGREIAIAATVAIITLFCLLHIMQIQSLHSDWYEAGKRTKKFLTAVDRVYVERWEKQPTDLYFVNIPLRIGEAWIFPVGLPDSVWFTFKSEKIRVHTPSSLQAALNYKGDSENAHVFRFTPEGDIEEIVRGKNNQIIIKGKK